MPVIAHEIGSKDTWPGKLTPTEMRVCELLAATGLLCLLGAFVLAGRLLLRWHRRSRGAKPEDTDPRMEAGVGGDSEGGE